MKKLSSANIQLHRQKATTAQLRLPSSTAMKTWIKAALLDNNFNSSADITIRFVDEPESADLNFKYRKQHGPTNILTFSFCTPDLSPALNAKSSTKISSSRALSARVTTATTILNKKSHLTKNIIPCLPLSGDLIICVPLVVKEARIQKLSFTAHLAHLIVHGILHLLGYTHKQKKYAADMEKQETIILKKLGYDDPYI